MGHDEEAGFATAQIASEISGDGSLCFANPGDVEAYATRVQRVWPTPDGMIRVQNDGSNYDVAVEYKRINEGAHGILTAIGQALSYVKAGFAGTMVVVPDSYNTLNEAGKFTMDVLEKTCKSSRVGVLSYGELDMTQTSPFDGKMTRHKSLELDDVDTSRATPDRRRSSTSWGFVREGETTPDTIFKWLLTATAPLEQEFFINANLKDAVLRLRPGADPQKYLSSAPGNESYDKIWRAFWFKYVLTEDMQQIWSKRDGEYAATAANMDLKRFDGKPRTMFGRRSDSTKIRLVEKLNGGEITEDGAWEEFAKKIYRRAHSFRETIDSGLDAFGLVDSDGKPTYIGHQFISAYEKERHGLVNDILRHALLGKGGYGTLLHYVFKLSEDKFGKDPFSFYSGGKFQSGEYLGWLESSLLEMRVLRKVSPRGGVSRRPLQAERTMMKKIGLVSGELRPGVGMVIDWPKVHEALEFDPQKTNPI